MFSRPVVRQSIVQIRSRRLTVWVDGVQRIEQPLPIEPLSNWDDGFPLVIGNEATGSRPWLGVVNAVRITSAQKVLFELSHRLALPEGHLLIPRRTRHLLSNAWRLSGDGAGHYRELAVNLLGFVPFGMLLGWRRTISLWKATAICAGLSLSIECSQLFVETRYPTLVDFVMNSLGGLLGALVVRRMIPTLSTGGSDGTAA